MILSIADILPRFPTYRVAVLAADGLSIPAVAPPVLEDEIRAAARLVVAAYAGQPLGDIPAIRVWREAYKAFGVAGTSHRSSVENLVRRVLQTGALPRINPLVDAYNAISIRHLMPAGADDLHDVVPPLAFRFARPGDTFIALGAGAGEQDPPAPGEVVYADTVKVLCRRWNWRQDARSVTTAATTRAVLTLQALASVNIARVEDAATQLAALLCACCGGHVHWSVADAAHPTVDVELS